MENLKSHGAFQKHMYPQVHLSKKLNVPQMHVLKTTGRAQSPLSMVIISGESRCSQGKLHMAAIKKKYLSNILKTENLIQKSFQKKTQAEVRKNSQWTPKGH